jgi:hypothetical protein
LVPVLVKVMARMTGLLEFNIQAFRSTGFFMGRNLESMGAICFPLLTKLGLYGLKPFFGLGRSTNIVSLTLTAYLTLKEVEALRDGFGSNKGLRELNLRLAHYAFIDEVFDVLSVPFKNIRHLIIHQGNPRLKVSLI